MNALLLTAALALGAPPSDPPATESPATWVGTSTSGGGEPLRITVKEASGERRLIEVFWPSFEKTTLEELAPTSTACDHADLAAGRERLDTVERCLVARLPDTHPTYDYVSKTKVRCVFGSKGAEPAVACKLQYCGWFDLQRQEPEVSPRASR